MAEKGMILSVITGIFLSIANIFLFFNKSEVSYNYLSGQVIKVPLNLPIKTELNTLIFVTVWIIIALIIILSFIRYMRKKVTKKVAINLEALKKNKSRAQTDLDILYELLKNNKKISTKIIARVFNIEKEKAIEWGIILEENNLAVIDYPMFSDPIIKIKVDDKKQKSEGKNETEENMDEEENEKEDKPLIIKKRVIKEHPKIKLTIYPVHKKHINKRHKKHKKKIHHHHKDTHKKKKK